MTKKEIKAYIKNGIAKDITNIGSQEAYKLCETIHKDVIGISYGVYGMTGAIIKDTNTGDFYAITARNSVLFIMV